ncbi:hypothetical protein BVRB_024370 [Beta vulgaris subsp. vulgaris]|uniref:Uncharacterized protein n=1 Tax=Beta vulgaris subsp. vulgaris TaxID=3555 RepID=A0A0J8B2Q7_BETVV|nr:hypothetical protein BVRB_024370 [Beta vulgaris subsp. vulgaris]
MSVKKQEQNSDAFKHDAIGSVPLNTPDEDDPLPELDGLPIEAKRLVKAALCDPGTSADFPILLKHVLDKATAGLDSLYGWSELTHRMSDRSYAESIARCRHLRHIVLMLGSDVESVQLLYLIAISTGNITRFINAGVFDDGEAEIALKVLQHIVSLPAGSFSLVFMHYMLRDILGAEAIAEDVEIVKGITVVICRKSSLGFE